MLAAGKHRRARTRWVAGLLALACACALAAPAPWYLWRSKTDGALTCAQTSPGAGWKKAHGPFKDARCTIRLDTAQ